MRNRPPARLLARPAFACLLAAALAGAHAAAEPVAPVRPPPPPATGPGSAATPFRDVEEDAFDNPANPSKKVYTFRPRAKDATTLPERAPVVLFLHGFGAPDPGPYVLWLRHIASSGALVVYPVYPAIEAPGSLSRYDTMWAGFEEALRRLATVRPAPDLSRIGVVGHSFGGGAAPALAARAAARGYGSAGLYVASWAPWFDLDRAAWASLPSHTRFLSVAFDSDRMCDPAMAAVFPSRAVNVPPDRRAFRLVCSDDHGAPGLSANHRTPLADDEADALDTRCVWRLDDALRAATFSADPAADRLVFTTEPEALSLGTWSDGRPIRPLLDTVPAEPPGRPRRVPAMWREGGLAEKGARASLEGEAFSALPLPPPTLAPARRLPRSERFLAEPPTGLPATAPDGWAVLAPPGTTFPADVLARWKQASVVLAPVAADGALVKALVRDGRPTALLVAPDGTPRLWKRADDPWLADAVVDLATAR